MVTNLGVRVADILNSPEANVGAAGNQAVTPKMIDKMSMSLMCVTVTLDVCHCYP